MLNEDRDDSREHPSRVLFVLLVVFSVASTVLGRANSLFECSSCDAQLFAYYGQKWLEGSLPYIDLWDNKPPGIFALTALTFFWFPNSFVALAVVEGIFILGCIATVYAVMRQMGAPWQATFLATAACAGTSNLLFYNQYGVLTEIYLLWPAALSIWAFCKGYPKLEMKWMVLAGIFAGLAALFKPPGLAPFLIQECMCSKKGGSGPLPLFWTPRLRPLRRFWTACVGSISPNII